MGAQEQLQLRVYQGEPELLSWIAAFYGFHRELILGPTEEAAQAEELADALETLQAWQATESNRLFMLYLAERPVGFLRLEFRGATVPWLEELYIQEASRRQGFGTQAIALVEEWLQTDGQAQALCLDVVPRNLEALHLYHKLGFVDLSLVTLRKEFGKSQRTKPVALFDKTFYM